MKSVLFAAVSIACLVSCKPEERADTAPVPDAPTAAAAPIDAVPAAAEPCPPAVAGYRFLPEGLDVPVAYHLRADRIYRTKTGRLRRRTALEFLEGDADSVLASVEKEMVEARYKARPGTTQPNNNIHVPYIRKGGPNVNVMVNPEAGDNPHHPDAKGMLYYDYPLDDPAVPPATGPQESAPDAG